MVRAQDTSCSPRVLGFLLWQCVFTSKGEGSFEDSLSLVQKSEGTRRLLAEESLHSDGSQVAETRLDPKVADAQPRRSPWRPKPPEAPLTAATVADAAQDGFDGGADPNSVVRSSTFALLEGGVDLDFGGYPALPVRSTTVAASYHLLAVKLLVVIFLPMLALSAWSRSAAKETGVDDAFPALCPNLRMPTDARLMVPIEALKGDEWSVNVLGLSGVHLFSACRKAGSIEVCGMKGALYASVSQDKRQIRTSSGDIFGSLHYKAGGACTLRDAKGHPLLSMQTTNGLGGNPSLALTTVPNGHVFATAVRRGKSNDEQLEMTIRPNVDPVLVLVCVLARLIFD